MATRMQHPEHGFHVVYTKAELDALIALGWTEDDGSALAKKLAPQAEPEAKRRGRPPKAP